MRELPISRLTGLAVVLATAVAATIAAADLWPGTAGREPAPPPDVVGALARAAESGLPLPRFVTLDAEPANVRRGPGKEYPIEFQFRRAGLPVEIVREFENWRLIRDAEGDEGWIFHSLLSGARTAVVAPWDHGDGLRALRADAQADAAVEASVEPRVVVSVVGCDGTWCSVEVGGRDGYLEQDDLWGVYPGETIE